MFPLKVLNPSQRTPWVTWGIILLCVLVFVFQVVQPSWSQRDIMAQYALVPARVMSVFYNGFDLAALATVFTSMFMHGGLLHIAGNMWFLLVFGDNVEDNFGSVRYAFFYVACGLAAAIAQIAIDPTSDLPMVGASGAIAGVLAAYLVLYPRARVLTLLVFIVFIKTAELPAFLLIATWFILQFFSGVMSLGVQTGGGVAYWAHIGGFIAGIALAFALRKKPPPGTEPARARRWDPDADWR